MSTWNLLDSFSSNQSICHANETMTREMFQKSTILEMNCRAHIVVCVNDFIGAQNFHSNPTAIMYSVQTNAVHVWSVLTFSASYVLHCSQCEKKAKWNHSTHRRQMIEILSVDASMHGYMFSILPVQYLS